jgi:ribosomal protein S27E
MSATTNSPFETVTCPYCGALVVARFPPEHGWPRTAFTRCDACSHTIVTERTGPGRFRARRHRGLFEGFLRL